MIAIRIKTIFLATVLICSSLLILNFIPISKDSSFSDNIQNQELFSLMSPRDSQGSTLNFSLSITDIPLSNDSVSLIINCNITAIMNVYLLIYDNNSILDWFFIPANISSEYHLNLTLHENAVHFLDFYVKNEADVVFYHTQVIYEIDSIKINNDKDGDQNIGKNVSYPLIILVFLYLGLSTAVMTPTYAIYRTVRKNTLRKQGIYTRNFEKINEAISIDYNKMAVSPVYGEKGSFFNSIMLSTIDNIEKEKFFFACSNLIELRIYKKSDISLIYRILAKMELMAGVKPSEIDALFLNMFAQPKQEKNYTAKNLSQIINQSESTLDLMDYKAYMIKIERESLIFCASILYVENDYSSSISNFFIEAANECLKQCEKSLPMKYQENSQPIMSMLTHFFNVNIAYPVINREKIDMINEARKNYLSHFQAKDIPPEQYDDIVNDILSLDEDFIAELNEQQILGINSIDDQ